MALTKYKISKIRAEFETGILSQRKLAQKYGISRNTLTKHSEEGGWVFGKNSQEMSQKIENRATEKLVQKTSIELYDFTEDFLKSTRMVENLTKATMAEFGKKVQSGILKKADSEMSLTSQRYLKEAMQTLSISFNDKRKALGLDKEKNDTNVTVNNSPPQVILTGVKPDEPCPT